MRVNGKSGVSKNTHLGANVSFNGMTISGHVWIGNNFHSGKDCMIIANNHNYDYGDAIPYDDTLVEKEVHIEDNGHMY